MKNTLETRLGIFFALALIGAAIILEMLGGLDFLRGGMQLRTRFQSIGELKRGDPVKMAGVQIGRVDEIGFVQDKVLLTMKITDRRATVRTDSKATIKFSGLMGQNYVALDFGSGKGAPVLPDAELESCEQPDFGAIMTEIKGVTGGIKKLTDNFSDANVGDLVPLVTEFLKESRPRIAGILTNAQAISEQIATGQGTVGRFIYDEAALYTSALATITNLNQTATDLQATVNEAKRVVAEVNAGKGTIGKLVTEEKLYAETTEAMTNLKEILQKINQGKGSIGSLVNDESLLKNAKMTLQKLDKATEGLEDQGPLSVLGMAVNSLF